MGPVWRLNGFTMLACNCYPYLFSVHANVDRPSSHTGTCVLSMYTAVKSNDGKISDNVNGTAMLGATGAGCLPLAAAAAAVGMLACNNRNTWLWAHTSHYLLLAIMPPQPVIPLCCRSQGRICVGLLLRRH